MKPTPNIDTDKPALSLETIAATITPDPVRQDALCARLRNHYAVSKSFRKSFHRKDERDVAQMWMNHWNEGMNARSLKTQVEWTEDRNPDVVRKEISKLAKQSLTPANP